MEQDPKSLIFRNKNLQADEPYRYEELEGKTFDQIAIDLWDRMRRKKVGSGFRANVNSSERYAARQSAKFSWKPPTGTGFQPINGARGVLEFLHETGAREIFYYFEPIGGAGYTDFQRHAQEIIQRPREFGTWKLELSRDGIPQIKKVVLDKFRRQVHVFIQPLPRYPDMPPRVVTRPPVQDACFSTTTGELGWARATETGQMIWSEHTRAGNPLAELLDELRRKYHVF